METRIRFAICNPDFNCKNRDGIMSSYLRALMHYVSGTGRLVDI